MPDTLASKIRATADLDTIIQKTILRDLFVTEDKNAHEFHISATRAGQPVDLTGATVTGYFLRYKNNITTQLNGEVSENGAAVVTLSDSCYDVRTLFSVTVVAELNGVRHALFVGEGQMVANRSDTITDPDNVIPSVADIIAQYGIMQTVTAETNTAKEAANTAAASARSAAQTAGTAATTANAAASGADAAAEAARAAVQDVQNAPIPNGATATYQAGTSATTPPTGTWQNNVPPVPAGQYLWTKIVQTYTNGSPTTYYSVARQGIDGSGSVASVDGVSPDTRGNVALGAVRSVNGNTPDGSGNVEIDAGGGDVQSVNGVRPDAETGNIDLTGSDMPVSPTDERTVQEAVAQHDNTITTMTAEAFEALTTQEKAAQHANGVRQIIAGGYGYVLDAEGNATPISDPNAMQRGETAENALKLGGEPASEYYTKDTLIFDDEPIDGSANPITSGAVFKIQEKNKLATINAQDVVYGTGCGTYGGIELYRAGDIGMIACYCYFNSEIENNSTFCEFTCPEGFSIRKSQAASLSKGAANSTYSTLAVDISESKPRTIRLYANGKVAADQYAQHSWVVFYEDETEE